ncbi:hypothetical protein AX774_g3132 [Zancudomyces culisetae]|uniref:Uncharacterized protein n=1 Tax=Zancudomyces culisetae TaxID=1213189 RepID=A0A1R1PR67_ZANCU|nr:hypothetical protein AX774_g3132 [Zancudomyces culisetae]|eukprot:OMH83372.1 hypothetical protein AX774_g3132 [Zancudomyces culisetae]
MGCNKCSVAFILGVGFKKELKSQYLYTNINFLYFTPRLLLVYVLKFVSSYYFALQFLYCSATSVTQEDEERVPHNSHIMLSCS